ncbi:lipase [Kitasatospora sp. NPDC018058]|uniref:lipase n=1 Tax=Kitasatospora sp. NPDC018058 TaxID=3364025 RepID=UPI0037BE2A2D
MTVEMRQVPLLDGPVEFRGALDLQRTETGVLPWRLPRWTRAQFPNEAVARMAALPSGVRMAFRTAATVLEVEALAADIGVLELVIDGVRTGRAEFAADRPARVRFDVLSGGEKDVEVWLPQRARTELIGLWADAEVAPPRRTGRRRWVHHGSSVSHYPQADSPFDTWPVLASVHAGVELTNLSLAGNARLDPFVARAIRDERAELISLKLGLNVVTGADFKLRSFLPAVHGFLDTVREGHPDTPVLVVSPISCPPLEEVPGPAGTDSEGRFTALGDPAQVASGALTVGVVRAELARIVAARRDPHLHHLDGRELLGPGDLAELPDLLHPSPAGHRRMAERFAARAFGPDGPFA